MKPLLSETLEERRKERDEAFSIRMIELSILATTLCGIMISFSFEANPTVVFVFFLSSSFFIASGMGLILLILLGRGLFPEKIPMDKIEWLRGLSVLVFLFGMCAFFLGIAYLAVFNTLVYVGVIIPFVIIFIPWIYYLHKHKAS